MCSLLLESSGASLAPAASITADVLEALKECPTKNYVVVDQEGVSAADYADGRSTPRLAQYMAGQHEHVRSTISVPDVVGKVDVADITKYLESTCGSVKSVQLDTPPSSKALRALYMGQQGTLHTAAASLVPVNTRRPIPRRQLLQIRRSPGLHRHLHHHPSHRIASQGPA